MPNPDNSGDLDDLRRLLDRLATLDPNKCMPDVIAGQWMHGDPDARRKIEEAIDRLPKKKKSN
jgi:hypothetical protein